MHAPFHLGLPSCLQSLLSPSSLSQTCPFDQVELESHCLWEAFPDDSSRNATLSLSHCRNAVPPQALREHTLSTGARPVLSTPSHCQLGGHPQPQRLGAQGGYR